MSGIRVMLLRRAYQGQLVYGRSRWQDRDDTKIKVDTPPAEWITRDAPEPRIVPEPLWQATHARLAKTRALYARRCDGRLIGRPEGSLESRYPSLASWCAGSAAGVSLSGGTGTVAGTAGRTTCAARRGIAGRRSVRGLSAHASTPLRRPCWTRSRRPSFAPRSSPAWWSVHLRPA